MQAERITITPSSRIDSWRAIAAFFQRDERTVRRWANERALPVHRSAGKRGVVFAYPSELRLWLHSSACPSSLRKRGWIPVAQPLTHQSGFPDGRATLVQQAQAAERGALLFWIAACALAAFLFFADRYHARVQADTRTVSTPGTSHGEAIQSSFSAHSEGLPGHGQELVQAREYCLRGDFHRARRTDADLQIALENYSRALAYDAHSSRAYAGLAATYELLPEYSATPAAQAFPKALSAAQQAVSLDPASAQAHRVLAFALFYWQWQLPHATREFERALALDPSDAETHHWYADLLFTQRRCAEARREIEHARELNPTSRAILADSILINHYAGAEPGESFRQLRELTKTEPEFAAPRRYLAQIQWSAHDLHGWAQTLASGDGSHFGAENRPLARAALRGWRSGGETGLLREVRALQQGNFEHGQSTGFDLAMTCLQQGDRQSAVLYLQAAFHAHDFRLLSLLHDPESAPLLQFAPFLLLRSAIEQRSEASSG